MDAVGSPLLPPGRFVAGTTMTRLGAIRFIGLCIPWRDAHVRSGRRDRRPWEDHLTYLHGLGSLLRKLDTGSPAVILGDFNQRIPRLRQPQHVFDALMDALGPGTQLATTGAIGNTPNASIDHLATAGRLVSVSTEFVDNFDATGIRMSDHFGLCVRLRSTTMADNPEPRRTTC